MKKITNNGWVRVGGENENPILVTVFVDTEGNRYWFDSAKGNHVKETYLGERDGMHHVYVQLGWQKTSEEMIKLFENVGM